MDTMNYRKFLITGGAGFIAHHLTKRLLDRGFHVVAFDNLSTGSRRNVAPYLDNPNFQFIEDTIFNHERIAEAIQASDFVFHLAAVVGVKNIIDNPVQTIKTNIEGTEIVIKECQLYQKAMFIASTSEVYGKGASPRFTETDDLVYGSTMKHRWSYACSKAIDEFFALAYVKKFGLKAVIARFFNTIGPKQTGEYGMVVPRLISQALNNEPLTVYGDGTQSRCFTYVGDVIDCLEKMIATPTCYGQVVNIGSDNEISILDLAKKIIAMTGSKSEIKIVPYDQAYEEGFEDMQRRHPNLDKLHALINFVPETTLDTAISAIVDDLRQSL